MEHILVNRASDFALPVRINKVADESISDSVALTMTLATEGPGRFVATRAADGTCVNCIDCGDGRINIIADSHGLPCGRLRLLVRADIPDDRFPDGFRTIADVFHTGIQLVSGAVTTDSSNLPELSLENMWVYIHDTDVYAEIMRKVNDAYEEILAMDGDCLDAMPAAAAAMPRIALTATGERLCISGHEEYLRQGYYPVLFRYGRFTCSSRKNGKNTRRFTYNGLRCFGQRYNCVIADDGRVGRVDNGATQRPYAGLSADMADFSPRGFLNVRTDAGGDLVASHGNGACVLLDSSSTYAFEYALAFVRPDIPHCDRITERHCVSNIATFQIVMRDAGGMSFTTTPPHRHRRGRRAAEA